MITIMLVDDHQVVRRGLRALLETEPDFRVVGEAGDGLEAVSLAQNLHPNVILYGGKVTHAGEIRHGKTSLIYHDGKGVFSGLASPITAVRYHSLSVQESSLPDCLEISAHTENGIIMGLRHKEYAVEGVQFHPESIMTKMGKNLLKNFLRM